MAHPSKFVSVNLNKSYGQPSNPSSSYTSSSRSRPGSHSGGGGGGGGGGMVVLSRPRSSSSSAAAQKASAPKLSVPPPLNLPSLRKENEKFDLSAASGSSARPGSSGIGSGSGLSSVGWTKPVPALLQDNNASSSGRSGGGGSGSSYTPPAARGTGQPAAPSSPAGHAVAEKAVLLRGEDFPSLKATVASGASKQKDLLNQKEKMKEDERERPEFHSPLRMRPQMRSSRPMTSNVADGDDSGLGRGSEQSKKQQQQQQDKYFPGPLPLVKLTHTSDWADDERDTGLSLPERDRDRGFSRTDVSATHDWDADMGSLPSRESYKWDSFGRSDLIGSNRDGRDVSSSWRTPPHIQQRDDRPTVKPFGVGGEANRDSSFSYAPYRDSIRDGLSNGSSDSRFPHRDSVFGMSSQNRKNVVEGYSGRSTEQQSVRASSHGDLSNQRYRGDTFQHNSAPKSPFSHGAKSSLNDSILNFGREKKPNYSNSGKPYLADSGFESSDPFSDDPISDVNIKTYKRKKEMARQADFHDPVRESFEAELERVQRIQEQERQRMMEEQARAMEVARREQEERERLAREEEERRRLIEEEAREAAWKAEQEKIEAARRAEEQKLAREEEKRRMLSEEERRKEAARQKLMELEARIARRQSETNQKDDQVPSAVNDEQSLVTAKEQEAGKVAADVGDWEDGERMVEHITSVPSDSSGNSYFDAGSSRFSSREAGSFIDRGKQGNYWKRDGFDNGSSSVFHSQNQSDYRSLRDNFGSSRGISRKDGYGSFGAVPTRPSSKGGTSDHSSGPDDYRYYRGNRWNGASEGDRFTRNVEVDTTDLLDSDRFADGGWGSDHAHRNPNTLYAERPFQNSEVDGGFTSYGRSRHSLRQPRVLPPPSVSSMRQSQSLSRGITDRSMPNSFLDSQPRYLQGGRNEDDVMQSNYGGGYHHKVHHTRPADGLETDVIASDQKEKVSPRCYSQSSLSVSNPPSSPSQPSNDELEEAEDSQALPASNVEEQTILSDNEHLMSGMEVANTAGTASSVSNGEDDEWAIENNEEMLEQEAYDEDDDYQEEDEAAHDGDEEADLVLRQEVDGPSSLDVPNSSGEMGQEVLGFNEGIEVRIPMHDDVGRTGKNLEKAVLENSVGDRILQNDNAFTEESVDGSEKIISETEKALQELVLDPMASPTANVLDSAEPTSVHCAPDQQPMPSQSSPMPSTSTVQFSAPAVSAVDDQAEAPIRLQFGLFSGPPLIPSPVPAIQIGSIQMPLHLHTQVGTSITQMHPPQPSFFQFGQLRYPPPISSGILPLAPQALSFVHPPASSHYPSSKNVGGSQDNQACQDSSHKPVNTLPSCPIENQAGALTISLDSSVANSHNLNGMLNPSNDVVASPGLAAMSGVRNRQPSDHHISNRNIIREVNAKKNYRPMITKRDSRAAYSVSSNLSFGEKTQCGNRAPGIISNSRGRRFAYTVRNTATRLPFPTPETSKRDSRVFQRRPRRSIRRTEFRVRENADKRQNEVLDTINNSCQDGGLNFGVVSGISVRYGIKMDANLSNSTKEMDESENIKSGASTSPVACSDGKVVEEPSGKEMPSKKRVSSLENFRTDTDNGKRNLTPEVDVDAPLQSGVVRIFKQSGIEAPSDEDDFIQVRSKRQMLNDRREQREKEIKAKSKVIKASRKHRTVPQSNVTSNPKKTLTPLGGYASSTTARSDSIAGERAFAKAEPSPVFTTNIASASQMLPPIGTPPVKADSDARSNGFKSSQSSTLSVPSSAVTKFAPASSFNSKTTSPVNASLSLGSWGNSDINQQVMALTQSQLDDAMKPAQFDSQAAASASLEPMKPPSVISPEKPFPLASPLNSLLAGERIQFGAVTSPTILPPVTRAVANGIGPPGPSRSDVSEENLPATSKENTVLYDKDKHTDDSSTCLEDPEAEAEAAASAVAVAAISNSDEIIGNRLGVCSVSDSKSFNDSENTEVKSSGGMASIQEARGHSTAEESLTVALPADLSVDTPLPLWHHPLPSPQSTSGPTLSHIAGGPHSHFPVGFDLNPVFGGPIFAFGPHDESGGSQSQPQRSTTLGSGPLGAWPQCHSGMDSFYGPPAGFTAPYISPPGGIPGVQAPPHMVVYNHFAPVGQFGQVGLSFMGTTYIPTGKQPEWKHNLVSSSTANESDINNTNQRNPPSMPSPIQHLAPRSPLMPLASPLAMFDMSPFQSSADIPYQARWSHVPPTPVHSVPLSIPLQQQQPPPLSQQQQKHPHQPDVGLPSQFSAGLSADTINVKEQFNDPQSSTSGDGSRVQNHGTSSQFPDEHLREPASASTTIGQAVRSSYNSSGANNNKGSNNSKNSSRNSASARRENAGGNNSGQNAESSFKPLTSQQQSSSASQQQYLHPVGYGDQRGGSSQKASGGEWHSHRMGYQNRGQGSDRGLAPSKMKQIYVAKTLASGSATTG